MKFLVIQLKMIGDVLTSTVICESLKYHFPKATVHMVANENTLPVLAENPFIDELIVFKKEYRSNKKKFYSFLKSVQKTKYYGVIDALGKLESNLITYFATSDIKIGIHKWYTAWVYSNTIIESKQSDEVTPLAISNRLLLLQHLVKGKKFITYPKIYLTDLEISKAKDTLKGIKKAKAQKLVMVNILGSSPHKTYPKKYMAHILDVICEENDVILLFNYIPEQKKEAQSILQQCSNNTKNCTQFNFYAPSLRDFIAILSQCDLLVGNEGGAVNMAKALNIPSFCIFSPFILKQAWHGNAYKNHESVHLKDFRPELFEQVDKKAIKKKSKQLYQYFQPQLFEEILKYFLKNNLH